MNRTSRRPPDDAADALLDAGRGQPVLHYDVEVGLARHHHWLRSEAPLPEWASSSVATAGKSLAAVVIKTIVSAVLMGALAVAAWHARGGPQRSAADVKPSLPGPESTPAVAPSMATTPIPISDRDLPVDQPIVSRGRFAAAPARRTVRADVPDKRSTHLQRAHKEPASARAANSAAVATAEVVDATPAGVEPPAPVTARPIEGQSEGVERAPQREVAAARARPEAEPQAQAPDDLAEMQQVATAEQLLERSPQRALALVRQGDQRFAGGYFQQERAYIAIMALIRLDRIEEARARAASFAKRFSALPYGARIRSALEARE